MSYYPVSLELTDRRCLVLGGGPIAEGKIAGLLEAGGVVRVISPDLTPQLQQWAREGRLEHIERVYQPGDLTGIFLAISATDDRGVNERVWQEATALNILINVVDDPPHCSFIPPSVVRRGDLSVAVSTGGKAPVLAVRLREQIERLVSDEHARFLELAGTIRRPLAERFPDWHHRKALWYRLVDSDVLELLREGDEAAARRRVAEIMGVSPA